MMDYLVRGRDRFSTVALIALLVSALTVLPYYQSQAEGEQSLFEKLAEEYNSSPQTTIEFRHILSSDFFETSDTVTGSIAFTNDGRYITEIGSDVYLFDGACLWEYSRLYAQASRNCLKPGQRLDDSFLFFRHFKEYYQIKPVKRDSIYQLVIHQEHKGKAPDSMQVTMSPAIGQIISMDYYDINDELNRILLGEETKLDVADSLLFVPNFPDSTEIIEIPG